MCLNIGDRKSQTEINNKFLLVQNSKKFIYAWKVISCQDKCFYSPFRYTEIKKGWYVSNRVNTQITPGEYLCDSIDLGIHIYLSRNIARREKCIGERVIKVKCFLKDFVAIESCLKEEAVFTKIFISDFRSQ